MLEKRAYLYVSDILYECECVYMNVFMPSLSSEVVLIRREWRVVVSV